MIDTTPKRKSGLKNKIFPSIKSLDAGERFLKVNIDHSFLSHPWVWVPSNLGPTWVCSGCSPEEADSMAQTRSPVSIRGLHVFPWPGPFVIDAGVSFSKSELCYSGS